MILVEDHDLLFIHVPQTGGTAIRRYLTAHLGGVPVGRTHQVWEQVEHQLPNAARLQIMTCVRNPLDQTVSSYTKLSSDYRGQVSSGALGPRRQHQQAFVVEGCADFEQWFLRYRKRVYSPRWLGSVRRSRWVLRFENLEADFVAALREAGVPDPPPLPRENVTPRTDSSFEAMYRSRQSRERAARVFGPFMSEFGYAPPSDWPWSTPWPSRLEYVLGHRVRAIKASRDAQKIRRPSQ